MQGMLEGVRVIEAAQWVMGPSAAAVLADWGATVIRVEHPYRGDPMRGMLASLGYDNAFDLYLEQHNHSKRSIGLDLGVEGGREVLLDLIADADVFLTSFLERPRQRWGITYEDLRARNPQLIYARTHGWGRKGPAADRPGYDAVAYWAGSGLGYMAVAKGARARPMPTGGLGDVQAGAMLAGGIAAALYGRTKTGVGALVDVSLLGMGIWATWESIQVSNVYGIDAKDFRPDGMPGVNPLTGAYVTRDHRDVQLYMLESDRFWSGFCAALELGALETDPRFSSFEARNEHREELKRMIDDFFAAHDFADIDGRLSAQGCLFAVYSTPSEVAGDEQAHANRYLLPHPTVDGRIIVSSPVQFDEVPIEVTAPAPEVGQHTEEILLDLGYTWDQIIELKDRAVII